MSLLSTEVQNCAGFRMRVVSIVRSWSIPDRASPVTRKCAETAAARFKRKESVGSDDANLPRLKNVRELGIATRSFNLVQLLGAGGNLKPAGTPRFVD